MQDSFCLGLGITLKSKLKFNKYMTQECQISAVTMHGFPLAGNTNGHFGFGQQIQKHKILHDVLVCRQLPDIATDINGHLRKHPSSTYNTHAWVLNTFGASAYIKTHLPTNNSPRQSRDV